MNTQQLRYAHNGLTHLPMNSSPPGSVQRSWQSLQLVRGTGKLRRQSPGPTAILSWAGGGWSPEAFLEEQPHLNSLDTTGFLTAGPPCFPLPPSSPPAEALLQADHKGSRGRNAQKRPQACWEGPTEWESNFLSLINHSVD